MLTLDGPAVASLRAAIDDCNDRGLLAASKWASELLQYVPAELRASSLDLKPPTKGPGDPVQERLEAVEEDMLRTARGYFWSKEFARASHTLKTCRTPKARFLALYSQFLLTEKKSQEEFERTIKKQKGGSRTGAKDYPRQPDNPNLSIILPMIGETDDAFLLFLKALLLHRLNQRAEAIEALVTSLGAYPWNWSAWQLLSRCLYDKIELANIQELLPQHPTQVMLQVYSCLERQSLEEDDLELCNRLLSVFPDCPMIIGWKAHCLYVLKELEASENLYDRLLSKDPFRIEGIDIYSAILYVLRKKTKLSKLARRFSGMSRDRPEVCCVIGDHYSIRGEHEKAIKYYRRAVLLDQNCVGAWTLLGHSYVEMKNAHAAIESYRRAIDLAPQDPRAWFGLGQAYALLLLFQYSLYYYQRAVALKPRDARIWQELASCYTKVGKNQQAADCLQRALAIASKDDTVIKHKLAGIYETLEDPAKAYIYHKAYMLTCERLGKGIGEYARSVIFVAKHHVNQQTLEDIDEAVRLLEKLANSNADENQLAKDALPKLLGARTRFAAKKGNTLKE